MTRMNTLTKLLCAVLVLCGLLCCTGAAVAEGDCAHTFTDGVCTTCGLTGGYCGASTNEGGEQSVTWTLADNHLVISGMGAMADYSYYSDLPWRDSHQTITDVTIGEGVTRIGKHAFYNFQSLTEISIPASVVSIGIEAFGNSAVSSVTFAPNSRLTAIDGYAFNCLESLKQITLPASVESIGDGAFDSCYVLETVTFAEGSRLSSLGYTPFFNCDSLTAISIPESVTAYKTIDGVLYSGDGTTLLLYPEGKTDESFTTPAGVTTIAELAFYQTQLHNITLSEGVTTIGYGAFDGCFSMQSVSLPSTLPSIGDSAFASCVGLTTVTIPASVSSIGEYAFIGCSKLTTVTIPASVTSIGTDAFYGCDALTTVNAPCSWDGSLYTFADTVTVNVPDHAFVDGKCTGCGAACEHPGYEDGVCTQCGTTCVHTFADGACTTCGLTGGYCGASTNEGGEQSVTWTLADNHLVISGTGAMADYSSSGRPWNDAYKTITDVTIGEGVTRIGELAFYNFRSLTEITIPASVESIGYQAFGNSTVSSVTFAPNSRLTTIDDHAFSYLVYLKQIILPASVETIGDGVFEYCAALETVTFEEGSRLSSLGNTPFYSCDSLSVISIPESVTAYKTIDGVLYSGDGTTLLLYPAGKTDEAFTTPAGVTTIAEGALSSAQFRTVILSEGVTTIGNGAFEGCYSMQSVSLPSTLTCIGSFVFISCSDLTEVTIPANVTSIGDSAFANCNNLTTVTIPASVSSIGMDAFSGCDNLTTVNAPCNWDGSLYTFEDTVTVNVPNHAFVDGKCTACGADCEHPGYEDGVCTQCGTTCAHTFADGACTTCGLAGGYCGASTNEGGEQSVTWTLSDNHLVISGTGAMADSYYEDLPWRDAYQTITDVTIGEGVTRIGKHAFYNFQSLAEISIPASVESIGYQAFRSSTVSSVTFAPDSRLTTIDGYAFSYLRSLKQIILPASVESIGDGAFESCGALETVTFEEGSRLSSLGYKPFFCCYSLTAISIPESVTACKTIDGVLYSGDGTTLLLYPAGKTDEAFTTPAGVTTIAESALYYVQFRTVTLSEGVTTIGNDAFFGCNSMQSVSLPSTLTSIGSYAFEGCRALTTVNAPCSWDGSLYTFADTVTVNAILHRGGTANCEQGAVCGDCGEVYTDLDPDNHTYASDICCGYCGASTNEGGVLSVTWTLNDGMLTISGTGAMEDYFVDVLGPWHDALDPITAVTIGNGVTHIGTWAFAYIDAETITFAANSQLTTIGYHAFEGSSLSEITIPASVETIGECAFGFCGNLSSVTFAEGSRLTSIGEKCFGDCSTLIAIIVPEDNTAYKTIDGVLYSGDGTTLIKYPAEKVGESFTPPAGVTTISDHAFSPNRSIRYLTLSEGVTTIGSYAISYCYDLTEVTIPASVTSIGRDAFAGFNDLTTVNAPCNWDGSLYTFEDTVTVVVADHAFADGKCTACGVTGGYCGAAANAGGEQSVVWTYRNGVLTITGNGAMADYDSYDDSPGYTYRNSITALTIQEGVTTIGRNAFHQTAGLKSVTIPASVTKLGYCAFAGSGLEAVTFADESQLTTIDRYAFQLCDELTEITLPAGVGSFRPDLVFYGCSALTDIHVAEGNTTYKGIDGVLYTADGTTLMFYPEGKTETSFTTPAGVTTIGQAAFSYKDNIKSVTLSEGVTTIGKQAFLFCGALAEVTIPASVESIGVHAFYDCEALTTVNAPCNWDGSLYTFADTVTVNVPEHTGGTANCQSGAICDACGEAYGELDYDVHAQTEVVWEWRPDDEYVYAYATLTCSDCGEELEVTSGEGEFLGEVEPTDCKNPGSMSYSATLTFSDSTVVTGTHTVVIPSENHVGPMSNGFCAACGSAEKPEVDPGEYEDETWDDVYLISNAGQLYWFANEVNGGNNGIGARLTANITVPASVSKGGSIPDWEPIGQGWTPYCGDFNGGGHTISGLYCVSNRAGLFGYTDYYYNIRNIGVVNGTFIGSDYAGALVGYASSSISGCWASGNTIEGNYAGGLVGQNIGTITGSRATGNTVKGELVGGLVGYNNNGTIGRSYGTGNTVTGDSAGGLVGENYGTVENSYSTGNSTGYLVGYGGGPITNCFTDGSALFRDSYGDVTNSYYVAASATDDGGRTSAQFESGEIAWLLQSGIEPEEVYDEETGEWVMADAALIWGQSIGSASYPTLGGKRVYQVLSCDGEGTAYSNTDEQQKHSFTDSVCVNCGAIGGFCGAEGDGTHIAWTLKDGTLTITGTGDMAEYDSYEDSPWYTYRNSITALTIQEGVTTIGGFAFPRTAGLKSVIIPATVKELGNNSFASCEALETVTFAEDSQLTTIGIRAFDNCSSLTEITLPEDVRAFDVDSVFGGCTALTNIFVAKNNETYKDIDGVLYTADGTTLMYYPEGKAAESFTTPDGVTTIADDAFYANNYLKTVTVSEGVTSIGLWAFGHCGNLETVNLPDSLTSIGWYAFDCCYTLTTVTIPDGVESIGDNAFQYCTALTTVTIPVSVESIGTDAFLGCDALTTVNAPCNWDGSLYTFEDTVTVNLADHSWTNGVCGGCGMTCPHDTGNGGACSICGATVERSMVILPASLTAVEAEAFTDTAVEAVVIPAGCTSIAAGAFSGCGSLKVIIFTSADCTIGDGAIPAGTAIIAPVNGTVENWAESNGLTFLAR